MFNWLRDIFNNKDSLKESGSDLFWDSARNRLLENTILDYIKHDVLELFIAGMGGTRFVDESKLSFTDANKVLEYIYRFYIMHPELHMDDLLEKSLIKLFRSEHNGYFFAALNTLDAQLRNEKNGNAPFRIDNPEVFISMKQAVIKKADYIRTSRAYRGKLYDNNLYGFVEEVDKAVEEQKGFKVI